jgi:hypothetical protein
MYVQELIRHIDYSHWCTQFKAHIQRLIPEEATEVSTRRPTNIVPSLGCFSILDLIDENDSLFESSGTPLSQAFDSELDSFLGFTITDPNMAPLQWWKLHYRRFPELARLARLYLSIPASSAEVERLFSASGRIITEERARLSERRSQQMLMLKKNKIDKKFK